MTDIVGQDAIVLRLRAEIERLRAQKATLICDGCRRLGEVADDNERLRTALSFYAEANWRELEQDYGKHARTALERWRFA